jgi:hypothetical protein
MSEAIEQGGGHFGIAKDARPFGKSEIGGDDDRGALVKPADEMEQELSAGLSEGQIAQFIEDDEADTGEMIGDASLAAGTRFGLEAIDEIDDVIEPAAGTGLDATAGDGDREMGLAGAGSADQDGVALLGDESAAGEVFDERFVDRRWRLMAVAMISSKAAFMP